MKVSKLKKALLILSVGMGLGGAAFTASAAPTYSDCVDLVAQCAAGNQNACNVVIGLCWRYGF